MAAGKKVRIYARVKHTKNIRTAVDLFHASNALTPNWVYLTTLEPRGWGELLVSTNFTLPDGGVQAIRGRYGAQRSSTSPCYDDSPYGYSDHDDLVFAVSPTPADDTPPSVTLEAPLDGAVVSQSITLSAIASDNFEVERVEFYGDGVLVGTVNWEPYTIVWKTAPGVHSVSARAYDVMGNFTETPPRVVTANAAPSVWFVSPEPDTLSVDTVHVVADASDDTAVTLVQFLIGEIVHAQFTAPPYEAELPASGPTTITVRAFDALGNTTEATLDVRVDGSVPEVAILRPSSTVYGTVEFSARANDDVGVERVEFFVDGFPVGTATSEPYSITWDTRVGPQDADITLLVRAYDLVGRTSEASRSVHVYNEYVPPTVTLTAPTHGEVVADQVVLSAVAEDNDIMRKVSFYVGDTFIGSPWMAYGTYQLTWDSLSVPDGAHTVTAIAEDLQGNTSSTSVGVVVDNIDTPPVVALTAPTNLSVVGGLVIVTADASDDRGVTMVEFLVDGTVIGTDTSEPWSFNWNSLSTHNGSKRLTSRAYDASGNVSTSEPREIVVFNDLTPPSLIIVSPFPGAVITGGTIVEASAYDNVGVERVEFRVNGVLAEVARVEPYIFKWRTMNAPEGRNTLEVRAFDFAGNVAQQLVSVTVRNDTTPPAVVLTSPSDAASYRGVVPLMADASDNRGVARVDFLVDGVVVGTDSTPPYTLDWDSTVVSDDVHWVSARAWDLSSLSSSSDEVAVLIENDRQIGEARYDETFSTPVCTIPDAFCFSGDLLTGRAHFTPEPNAPNTLFGTCPDGTTWGYFSKQSIDSIRIESEGGTPLTAGERAIVSVKVDAMGAFNHLDIYHAADANNPSWTLVSEIRAPISGIQTLTTTLTLPPGPRQAVRASLRFSGPSTPCSSGGLDERDDLVFSVAP